MKITVKVTFNIDNIITLAFTNSTCIPAKISWHPQKLVIFHDSKFKN